VGAGLPAMQAPQCLAPASPVIAGKPAPTVIAQAMLLFYKLALPLVLLTGLAGCKESA